MSKSPLSDGSATVGKHSLGTMLQEMAVAVARLDAVFYADSCHAADNAKCDLPTSLPPVPVLAAPSLLSVRSSDESDGCQLHDLRQRKRASRRRHASQDGNHCLRDGLGRNVRKVPVRRASYSSAVTSASTTSASARSKRTMAPSTASVVSTAASFASEASGSELVSDGDISQPMRRRAGSRGVSKPSAPHRTAVLQDFFAASRHAVPPEAKRPSIPLTMHAPPQASTREREVSRRSQYQSTAGSPSSTKPATDGIRPSSLQQTWSVPPAGLTAEHAGHMSARRPPVPTPLPPPVAECALCGGAITGPPGSCFCSACAARLEVLGPTSQTQKSTPSVSASSAGGPCADAATAKEASYCVLCSGRFVCSADSASSLLCPSCLGSTPSRGS